MLEENQLQYLSRKAIKQFTKNLKKQGYYITGISIHSIFQSQKVAVGFEIISVSNSPNATNINYTHIPLVHSVNPADLKLVLNRYQESYNRYKITILTHDRRLKVKGDSLWNNLLFSLMSYNKD